MPHAKIKHQNQLASVAQSDVQLTADQEVVGSICPDCQHTFVEIHQEIFSMVIFSLPLIQEGQLSVSGKRVCTSTGLPL